MFKRIRSDKERPALVHEFGGEFGKYISVVRDAIKRLFDAYPRTVYSGMIAAILFSAALAFTVMRAKPEDSVSIHLPASESSLSAIQTGNALWEVLALQNQINTILQKKSLNAADSSGLKQAFKKLEIIQSQIKSIKK